MEWFVALVSVLFTIAIMVVSVRLWLHEGIATRYLEVKAQEFRSRDELMHSILHIAEN